MTNILTKYIGTEVQSYRSTQLNFSVKQLNIDQIHRYRGTQLEFSAVYPLIQQNFIDSSPRYRGTQVQSQKSARDGTFWVRYRGTEVHSSNCVKMSFICDQLQRY